MINEHRVPLTPALGEQPSRRSQITQLLRAAVISGEMQVGTIYSAPALAAQFGVSATPVREAMIDLVKEGLVTAIRNKGFRVTEPTAEQLQDIVELRLLLEVPTLRRVISIGITKEQFDLLRYLAETTFHTAQREDYLGHVAADLQFHVQLLSVAGNREIVEVVRIMRSRSRLYGLHAVEKRELLLRSAREHLEMLDLVVQGRTADAEALLTKHISRVGADWSLGEGGAAAS